MLLLTKLDKSPVLVNIEAVKYVEAIPDTLIVFLNGDSLIVLEKIEDFIEKALIFKANIIKKSKM